MPEAGNKRVSAHRALATALGVAFTVLCVVFSTLSGGRVAFAQDAAAYTQVTLSAPKAGENHPLAGKEEVLAGEGATFRGNWSCNSVSTACENVVLTVAVPFASSQAETPVLTDREFLNASSIQVSDAGKIRVVEPESTLRDGTRVFTWRLGKVDAGATGQFTVLATPANLLWPDGKELQLSAQTTSDTAESSSAKAAVTVRAKPALEIYKKAQGEEGTPATYGSYVAKQGDAVTYELHYGYPGSRNNSYEYEPRKAAVGTLGFVSPVITDKLPAGAQFVAANNGGEYDPETHTVTWKPGPEGKPATSGIQAPLAVTVRYAQDHPLNEAEINTAKIEAQAYAPGATGEKVTADASHRVTFSPRTFGGTWSKSVSSNDATVGRGGTAKYSISLRRTGNTDLEFEFTDNLPCALTSPADDYDGACSTPGMTDVSFWAPRPFPGGMKLEWVTNKGNTGSFDFAPGSTSGIKPTVGEGEWVTKIRGTGTIAGNSNQSDATLAIEGRVATDAKADENTPYEGSRARARADKTQTFLENCANVNIAPGDGGPGAKGGRSCADILLVDPYPTYGVGKWIVNDKQQRIDIGGRVERKNFSRGPEEWDKGVPALSPGGSVDYRVGLFTGAGADLHPVIVDVLPVGVTYDPSVPIRISRNWPESLTTTPTVHTEMIRTSEGMQQRVTFTFGDTTVPPNWAASDRNGLSYASFIYSARIAASAPTRVGFSDIYLYDAKTPNLDSAESPNHCLRSPDRANKPEYTGKLSSAQVVPVFGDRPEPEARACIYDVGMRVQGVASLQGLTAVQGKEDPHMLSTPEIGSIYSPQAEGHKPGATLRNQVSNPSNQTLTNIVLYDILPYPGDTDVIGQGMQRGSGWAALIEGPIKAVKVTAAADGGEPVVQELHPAVLYNTALNPKRDDVTATGQNSPSREYSPVAGSDGWISEAEVASTNAWSSIRSFRADFGDLKLEPGEYIYLDFPVQAPTGTKAIAWNSFAVIADNAETGEALLPSEPAKVGLAMPAEATITKKSVKVDQSIYENADGSAKANEDIPRSGNYPEGTNAASTGSSSDLTWNLSAGSYVDYAIEITNEGPGGLTEVSVGDKLPDGVEFVAAAASNGFYDPATGIWRLTDLEYYAAPSAHELGTWKPITDAEHAWDYDAKVEKAEELKNAGAILRNAGVDVGQPATLHLTVKIKPGFEGKQLCNSANLEESNILKLGNLDRAWRDKERYHSSACDYVGVKLGDLVWNDANSNGVHDEGEPGLGGVVVQLLDANGEPVTRAARGENGELTGEREAVTATTDANGFYEFVGIAPGRYTVRVDQSTLPGAAENRWIATADRDSRQVPVDGQTVVEIERQNIDDADFGFAQAASIGDLVWYDANGDGIQNRDEQGKALEEGLAGVTVTLTDENGAPVTDLTGKPVAPAVTDTNGNYAFESLRPGTYRVQFTPPAGYLVSPELQGEDRAVDSDGLSATVTVGAGEKVTSIDSGFYLVGSIGDTVWDDRNLDGQMNDGEAGLPGVPVSLLDAEGQVIAETVTDAAGTYHFENLLPGTYRVRVSVPAEYKLVGGVPEGTETGTVPEGTTADPRYDLTGPQVQLTHEQLTNMSQDFGVTRPAVLGDLVWDDADRNGIQGEGEKGLAGARISLTDPDGNPVTDADGKPVTEVTTDETGAYRFTNLRPGSYRVVFTGPEGWALTAPGQGEDRGKDSDATLQGQAGNTGVGTASVLGGEENLAIDAGYYLQDGTLFGTVWNDADASGAHDSGEPWLSGVQVDLVDANGKVVATTHTDESGNYRFTTQPGSYHVVVSWPEGFEILTGAPAQTEHGEAGEPVTGPVVAVIGGQATSGGDYGFHVAPPAPEPEPTPTTPEPTPTTPEPTPTTPEPTPTVTSPEPEPTPTTPEPEPGPESEPTPTCPAPDPEPTPTSPVPEPTTPDSSSSTEPGPDPTSTRPSQTPADEPPVRLAVTGATAGGFAAGALAMIIAGVALIRRRTTD